VVERVRAEAPKLPAVCDDRQRAAGRPGEDSAYTVVAFTSDWCDACDATLEELARHRDELVRRKIAVLNAVTGADGSCVAAARVGRRAPFPYAATSSDLDATWAVRSTPTSWVLGPGQAEVVLYIEGELNTKELLGLLEQL